MRVIIVGGAGFIGSALAQVLLSHDHSVCVLDRPARLARMNPSLAAVDKEPFDFPDTAGLHKRLTGADAVAHLACTTDPSRSMQSMVFDAETNIAPSLAIFEAAAKSGIKRIVFSSSGGTVYGQPDTLPVSESSPTRPICAYGVSKLAVENYLTLFAASRGLQGISLRVANPYGPFQFRGTNVGVIARYIAALKAGDALEVWGDGTVVRDFIHVDDVARAMAKALTLADIGSGFYNIGSGVGTSVNEIIGLIFDVTGCKTPVRYKAARPYDVQAIYLDSRRFRAAADWTAKISLRTGIGDMCSHISSLSLPAQ